MTQLEHKILLFIQEKLENPKVGAIMEVKEAFNFYTHLLWAKTNARS